MADSSLWPGPDLVDVVADVLAEHGPMTEEQLIEALDGRGVDLGDEPDLALAEVLGDGDGLLTLLADGRWVSLPALLADRVFTHRLAASEVQHDILHTNPDLDPVDMLTEREEYQRLADGSPVVQVLLPFDTDTLAGRGIPPNVIDDLGALLLPAGYLRGRDLHGGDVIALRITRDGLGLEVVEEREVPPERLAGVGAPVGRGPGVLCGRAGAVGRGGVDRLRG